MVKPMTWFVLPTRLRTDCEGEGEREGRRRERGRVRAEVSGREGWVVERRKSENHGHGPKQVLDG